MDIKRLTAVSRQIDSFRVQQWQNTVSEPDTARLRWLPGAQVVNIEVIIKGAIMVADWYDKGSFAGLVWLIGSVSKFKDELLCRELRPSVKRLPRHPLLH